MKNLVLTLVLIFVFCVSIFAQVTSPCPTIKVIEPAGITHPGDIMTFVADVSSKDKNVYDFKWKISQGKIVQDQGTSVIRVTTNDEMNNQSIRAVVEVGGIPKECQNIADGSGIVTMGIYDGFPLFEYERESFKIEQKRIDLIAQQFKEEKTSTIAFIFGITEKDSIQELKKRASKISEYLINTHKISKERFTFLVQKTDSYRTQVFLLPAGAELPQSWGEILELK